MKKTLRYLLGCCLLLALALGAAPAGAQENLLKNGGFDEVTGEGLPAGWYTDAWINTPGTTEYALTEGREGGLAASIVNLADNDARFAQSVRVSPDTVYCFSGYIRADATGGLGANLSIEGLYVFSECVYDTGGAWKKIEWYGRTGASQTSVTVFARLGGYSGESMGAAAFDDLSLTAAEDAPAGATIARWYQTEQTAAYDTLEEEAKGAAWPYLTVLAALFAAACFLARAQFAPRELGGQKPAWAALAGILLVGLIARLWLSAAVRGYEVDINCFVGWAYRMRAYGPGGFYSPDVFCDYPPAYLYVLWLLGWIFEGSGTASMIVLKLVPVVCDLGIAAACYAFSRRRVGERAALSLAALFAFSPALLCNTAAWGQVDSVLALGLLAVCVLAMERNYRAALPVYMLCALVKPQALMLGPLGLTAVALDVWARRGEKNALRDALAGAALALVVAAIVLAPFTIGQEDPFWIIALYAKTLASYPYATVNTANVYYLFGGNWAGIGEMTPALLAYGAAAGLLAGAAVALRRKKWLPGAVCALAGALIALWRACFGMTYAAFGTVLMALTFVFVLALYARGGSLSHLPLLGGVLFIGLYVLGVKMHERYLFPALPLLALAYAAEKDRRILWLLAGFTVTTFLNTAVVLDNSIRLGSAMGHINADNKAMAFVWALANVGLCALAFHTAWRVVAGKVKVMAAQAPGEARETRAPGAQSHAEARLLQAPPQMRMRRIDYILMLSLTAAYAVLAFWHLGATDAPQTGWLSTAMDEQVVVDLGEDAPDAYRLLYYGGINYAGFTVATSEDGVIYGEEYAADMGVGRCFQWKYLTYPSGESFSNTPRELSGRYVRITADAAGLNLLEVIVRDENGNALPVAGVTALGRSELSQSGQTAERLFDEQDTLTGEPGWYNSMYFDEIYHARTAYEHLHGIAPYETSHPPLGKVIMSWCVALFGMTPFGWRFAGALMGVLMLPAMYLMAKCLTRRTALAFGAQLLLAVDCMHYAQTRIATIDSFVVLFIMLSTLCMYRYILLDDYALPFGKTLIPLALSGLFMGLAVASKWTGCYAGVGLAALFFWSRARRLRESKAARALLEREGKIPAARLPVVKRAAREGRSRLVKTLACCLVFFVAVPLVIYYVSYIPYFAPTGGVSVQRVIEAAIGVKTGSGYTGGMLGYHSTPGLGMDHPFYSPWYEWPLSLTPMYFASDAYEPAGMASSILSFGNLAVWWGGFAALLAVLFIWLAGHVRARGLRGMPLRLDAARDDMRPAMLLIGFAAQFMPWVLVPRGTYIYHYFGSVPFIILCAALCFEYLAQRRERLARALWYGYLAAACVLFALFFPYASGLMAPTAYLTAMNWLPRLFPGMGGWLYY